MKGPTHIQGHVLGLDLSHNLLMSDLNFSDHKPLRFTVPLHIQNVKPHGATRWPHVFNCNTINTFRESWMMDDHLALSNPTCLNILESAAPLISKPTKVKTMPWLNENTEMPTSRTYM